MIKRYIQISRAERQYLREHKKDPVKDIAAALGRSTSWTGYARRILGLSLPNGAERGQFKKGRISHNKGKKMSPEMYAKCAPTMYKKGRISENTKPVGTIVVRNSHVSRNNPPYQWIKIAEHKWIELHRYLWEKKHGKKSKGQIIVFKDGNTMNCVISNLESITRQEGMDRNRNVEKATASNKENWVSGKRYDNDVYIARLILGYRIPKEKIVEQLKKADFRKLMETKKIQLKLKREIKNAERRNSAKTK